MINTLFMGRKNVAEKCLQWLVKHPKFKVKGFLTDEVNPNSSIYKFAYSNKIKVFSYDEACEVASKGFFDFGVSVLYNRKLKGPLLFKETKYGCINFHPAILPDYKGCGGYNLAILNDLERWGTSCHYVDENIDTGSIIDVDLFDIDPLNETAKSLEIKTLNIMEFQFSKILERICNSEKKLSSKPNKGGIYVSRKEMELMKEIKPGDDPDKKARAFFFPPYLGAYVFINGEKYPILPKVFLKKLINLKGL